MALTINRIITASGHLVKPYDIWTFTRIFGCKIAKEKIAFWRRRLATELIIFPIN